MKKAIVQRTMKESGKVDNIELIFQDPDWKLKNASAYEDAEKLEVDLDLFLNCHKADANYDHPSCTLKIVEME